MSKLNTVERVAQGLTLLAKYNDSIVAERDVILVGPSDPKEVKDDDQFKLKELGWFISDKHNAWMTFV